jgi:S1-C subfamily serine protease
MRCTFALFALAAAAEGLALERVADPTAASVFIRVLGKVEIEVDSSWVLSAEERDVELGTGSGFVFTPYGHVLTNHHVVSGDSFAKRLGDREVRTRLSVERIEVLLRTQDPDSPTLALPASVEVTDPELDLAVLSVAGASLPYLALGDSDAAEPGEDVRVYGFPFGRHLEVAQEEQSDVVPAVSVSRGTVSAVRGDATGNAAFLQTSATVNPGNSGGPMVDAEGFVLGVVRLKLKEGDGIGFAIPVNAVKDFLEVNGYGGLVPVERLRLGSEEALEGKGLTLRLPDSLEDRSLSRLRVGSDPSPSSVTVASDRVATTWDLARLEEALLSGEAFGAFRATRARKSQAYAEGRMVLGSATGQVGEEGVESKIEYALFENGVEKVVLRYVGPAEAVAFNRFVLKESLRSARVDSLLGSPVERPIAPGGLAWEAIDLPTPSAPSVVLPGGWDQEPSAPFPCRGLSGVESAIAASPPGDFRISLRAGWWGAGPDPASAARACSKRAGSYGASSYSYAVEYLGVGYAVSGAFIETDEGLLQLEVVSPVEAESLVSDLARSWLEGNRRKFRSLPRP